MTPVKVDFKTKKDSWIPIASETVGTKKWTQLTGTFNLNYNENEIESVKIYVEGPPKTRDFYVDSASLKAVNPSVGRPSNNNKPSLKPLPTKPTKHVPTKRPTIQTPMPPSIKPSVKPAVTSSNNEEGKQSSGDITVYAPKPNGGNCGYPKFSKQTEDYFVAIPKAVWEEGANCGRCIEAKCTAGQYLISRGFIISLIHVSRSFILIF